MLLHDMVRRDRARAAADSNSRRITARTAVKSVQVPSALDLRRDGSTKTPQPNDFLSVFFDIEGPPMMIMWLKTVVHSGGGKWSLIIDMSAGEHSAREAPTWAMSS